MRVAASSIASGTPSSDRQMRATSAALSSVTSNRGSTALARSRNRRTAGAAMISADAASAGSDGRSNGSTSNTCSSRSRSRDRLVTSTFASGSAVSSVATSGADETTCSKLSSTMRSWRPARANASRSIRGRSPRSRTPNPRAIAGSTSRSSRTCSRATNVTRSNAIAREARDLEGQAGLADPTGAHERDEPAAVILAEPRDQRRHLRVPSDDTGRRQRERRHGRGVVGAMRSIRSAHATHRIAPRGASRGRPR